MCPGSCSDRVSGLRGSRRASRRRPPTRPRQCPRRPAIAGRWRDRSPARPSGSRSRLRRSHRAGAASFDALDKDLDLAAAGEPDLPRLVVGDAEIEEARLAVADHVEPLGDNRAFDTAARYRADKRAGIGDCQLGADQPRRGAPGADYRRQRDTRAGFPPAPRLIEDLGRIAHAALSWFPCQAAAVLRRMIGALSTAIRASRLSRLCTGRNSSTYGIIAFIPSDFGSNPS